MLELHEELLGEMHAVIPFSDQEADVVNPALTPKLRIRHSRWKSADAASIRLSPGHSLRQLRRGRRSLNMSRSSDQDCMATDCSPQTVVDVARVFLSKVQLILHSHRSD